MTPISLKIYETDSMKIHENDSIKNSFETNSTNQAIVEKKVPWALKYVT